MRRAVLGAFAVVLLMLFAGLTPASAQEDPFGDGGLNLGNTAPAQEDSGLETPPDDNPVDEEPEEDREDRSEPEGGVVIDEGDGAGQDAGSVEDTAPQTVGLSDEVVQIVEVDRSAYPNVDLIVSVPPSLAGELAAGAFAMTENNQIVRDLSVGKLRDAIDVVLVVDTSGSMQGAPMTAAKQAAKDFVAALEPGTRVAVVGFGPTPVTVAGLDSSTAEVNAAIDSLTADGTTALYDALIAGVDEFGESSGRQFLVVLSDGADTASSNTLAQATSILQGSPVNLYAVTLSSGEADFGALIQLTGDVEGQVVSAADAASLTQVYADLASRLANQYELSFRSRVKGAVPVSVTVASNGSIGIARDVIEFAPSAPIVDNGVVTPAEEEELVRPTGTAAAGALLTPEPEGFFHTNTALYLGAGAVGLALLGIFGMMLTIERVPSAKPSAFSQLDMKKVSRRQGGLASIGDKASNLAESALAKRAEKSDLDSLLEKGAIDMRPGEFIMTAIGVATGVAAVGFVMYGVFGLPGGFILGLLGSRTYIRSKAKKRQKLFGAQLGDTLMMMAGSLRSGHGIVEAIDSVGSQGEAPTGEEFSRVVSESRIGRDIVDSLYDVAARTESEDFIWVVRAISINRELGGDLAEILDNVGDTIRDRNRLRDQVKALSAEGKVSAAVLISLPIGVTAWVKRSNPEYLASMTDFTAGKILAGFAAFLLLAGAMWLKKLINVEF